MWECYYKGMSKQKLIAYIGFGFAGLGAMYLLATSPASPGRLEAFGTPTVGDDACTDQRPITGLHKSSIDQLKQLAEYQELCGSAVTKTLVASEEANLDILRTEAKKYGITIRTVKELRSDTATTWLMVSTESAAPTSTRARKLQAATEEAERLQKQGKDVGFYLEAGSDHAYFGDSEPLLKAYLTRWYDMGIRIALGDHGEYADIHDHEH